MDQKNSRLEVDQTIGRDVREEDFETITNVLSDWCRNCDNILSNFEHQMSSANRCKEESYQAKAALEIKIANVKKNVKNVNESDDIVMTDVVYGRDIQQERIEKNVEGRRSGRLNTSSKFIKGIGGNKTANKSWRRDN